ncbi:hypothetical protein [Nevskia sp.]|uniref:phage tail tube protein n=1 Tax=Nevskia sp. TaxID=1929292 RepID=UPI0025F6DC5B|nr:hypothetical protein [Nevskia sp.]
MATKQTYYGVGKVYLAAYGGLLPLLFVGNCSQLDLAPEENEQSIQDFTSLGGGKYDSVRRVAGVGLTITQWDLSAANLARHLRGTASTLAAATITGETHTAQVGGLIELARLPNPAVAMTVTGTGGTPVYVAGTDYERTPAGIVILEGGTLDDDDPLVIGYGALATDVVQALTQADGNFRLVFEGLNEAESGSPVIVRCHRVKFGPLQTLPLIGEGFASITIAGDVLRDTSITGAGLSPYFTVERALAAA